MRYDPYKRFQGHLSIEDPRSVTTVAGGCTWPTIPAYRYLLTSDNPVGPFGFLATTGLLVQSASPITDHDFGIWLGPVIPVPGVTATVAKVKYEGTEAWMWIVGILVPTCPLPAWGYFGPKTGKCNVDVTLGNIPCIIPSIGETGSDLQMRQCEWDQTGPPYPWP